MSANQTTLTDQIEDIVSPLFHTKISSLNRQNEIRIEIKEFQSLTISFSNINYRIGNEKLSKTFPFCNSIPCKQILDDVSGYFPPGMNAILGPTGCGKSTLLDILADRKNPNGFTGNVYICGQSRPKYFKSMIGYVVQDDMISETLTVRENLLFSANVRLPCSIKLIERIERVNEIMNQLDLQSCANTLIGTDFLRGVSGGERKRTSIGMELVLQPNILFLDEPTTGLDASTAQNVMTCLHRLSKEGRTIIFSIHQPRYSIFKLFDQVLFLSGGQNIYLGSPNDVLPYFNSLGYQCEEHDNPADFVLDILIQSTDNSLEKLRKSFLNSRKFLPNCRNNSLKFDYEISSNYRNEFIYVVKRTFCNVLRNSSLFSSQIFSVIIYGLFTGLIFNKLEKTVEPGVYNRFGAIFFIISCQVLGSMSALEPLIKERALFIHENLSGYYHVSSFFLSKLLIDLPLVHIIPSIIYAILTYFLTDLRRSTKHFYIFFLTNLITKMFGSSMCYFVAASTSTFGVALVLVICGYVTMMLFSGFLIDIQSITPYLRWIQYISVFRYASNILTINEFTNLTLCLSSDNTLCITKGEDILTRRHIDHSTDWDLWQNIVVLILITCTFFLFAFIQLIRIKKYK